MKHNHSNQYQFFLPTKYIYVTRKKHIGCHYQPAQFLITKTKTNTMKAVILNFEQTGREECKTVAYVAEFKDSDTLGDVLEWVQSIDKTKSITDVYFNDRD